MKNYLHPITNEVMTRKDYFDFMFGEEFMKSDDKGTLKEYQEPKEKIMFKVILKKTWKSKRGETFHWQKYLKLESIERVFDFYAKEDILDIQQF